MLRPRSWSATLSGRVIMWISFRVSVPLTLGGRALASGDVLSFDTEDRSVVVGGLVPAVPDDLRAALEAGTIEVVTVPPSVAVSVLTPMSAPPPRRPLPPGVLEFRLSRRLEA